MGRTLGPPAGTLQPFHFPPQHRISDEWFVSIRAHSCSFVLIRVLPVPQPRPARPRPRTGRDAIRVQHPDELASLLPRRAIEDTSDDR
jgi:hypothetical protein